MPEKLIHLLHFQKNFGINRIMNTNQRFHSALQTRKMDTASQILFRQHFSHCEITENRDDHDPRFVISILPIWNGVDRPNVGGWGLPLKDRKLAERLRMAVISGAAFADIEKKTDVNGKTYISAPYLICSRMMNADLNKLGY